jgi:Replication-relaxation
VTLLRLQFLASRVPALLDALRLLWLVPNQLLAAAAAFAAAAAGVLTTRSSVLPRRSIAERAIRSGQDLALLSVQFGARGGPSPRMLLTERDLRLMARLLDVNYLSTSQLTLLGWGASGTRAAQQRLKVLHDAGYIDRFRPVRMVGSAEWVYRLSRKGWKTLVKEKLTSKGSRFKQAAFTSLSYTEHDLELSSVILHIAVEASGSSTHGLLDTMPFQWIGPRTGRIPWPGPRRRRIDQEGQDGLEWDPGDDLEPERKNIARSPAARLPRGTHMYWSASRSGYLEPDATLIAGSGDERFAVLIEYDRTDRPHKQIDRLRRYDWWLLEGWRDTEFAAHASSPAVLFITSRERPLRRLVETADKTFSAWYGHRGAGARETTHPARKRTFFTSRERILEGEWHMQKTPELPRGLREREKGFTPWTVLYELPTALARRPAPPDDAEARNWLVANTASPA